MAEPGQPDEEEEDEPVIFVVEGEGGAPAEHQEWTLAHAQVLYVCLHRQSCVVLSLSLSL